MQSRVSFNAPRVPPTVPETPAAVFIAMLGNTVDPPEPISPGPQLDPNHDMRPRWDEPSVFGSRGKPGPRRPSKGPPNIDTGMTDSDLGPIPVLRVNRSFLD